MKRRKAMINLSSAFTLIGLLIGAVVSFVIVSALFPVIDQSAGDLVSSASNSTNTLMQKLSPVVPYIVGVALFLIIMFPIAYVTSKLGGGAG